MSCDYVLFSHLYEKTLNELLAPGRRWLQELMELLEDSRNPGMAVLFYHSGWQGLVRGTLFGTVDERSVEVARQAGCLAQQIERAAVQYSRQPTSRLRIVTALDLLPLVREIATHQPAIPVEKLANFLGTNFAGSRYDFPKLVESFLRLRNPTEVPILRVDQDVLFNEISDPDAGLSSPAGLRAPIQFMVAQFHRLYSQSDRQPFLISGQYQSNTGQRPTSTWTPKEWQSAFATRPYPALIIDESGGLQFEDAMLRAFYGIDETGTHLEVTADGQPQGIACIGAPPLISPISGALMVVSPELTAAIPPFCNFRTNVVWIDDFLNYAVHRELSRAADHTFPHGLIHSPLCAECEVAKARPIIADFREYARTNYLPALVRGCIFDAWIQPDSRTKIESGRIAPPGPFIRYLRSAQESGGLSPIAAEQCREELNQAAWVRLNQVRDQWLNLPNGTLHPTLAAEWLAEENLASLVELEVLLDDTLEYIEWAVAWPKVIETVCSIPWGSLKIDLPVR